MYTVLQTVTVCLAGLAASATVPQKRQSCTGQSCTVAALAGSSNEQWNGQTIPDGTTPAGICCVGYYNQLIWSTSNPVTTASKAYCSLFPYTPSNALVFRRDALPEAAPKEEEDEVEDIAKRQFSSIACASKVLIWARGTFEPPGLGLLVGPQLQSALNAGAPGKWAYNSIAYDPSIDGDNCLGLPGGVDHGVSLIKKVIAQCPKSKIFVGGYSQGAMVVRNAIAYGGWGIGSKISGVITYGDPFNGASIKNYNGPIFIYCASDDGVCSGELQIGASHLSYGSNVTDGARRLNAF